MRLGKAEYQDLFNAKVTAEKNYKIRERTSDFFGGRKMLAPLALALALAARTRERAAQNHHQARQAGLGGYGR